VIACGIGSKESRRTGGPAPRLNWSRLARGLGREYELEESRWINRFLSRIDDPWGGGTPPACLARGTNRPAAWWAGHTVGRRWWRRSACGTADRAGKKIFRAVGQVFRGPGSVDRPRQRADLLRVQNPENAKNHRGEDDDDNRGELEHELRATTPQGRKINVERVGGLGLGPRSCQCEVVLIEPGRRLRARPRDDARPLW
jgi:hypothetical protein